MSGKAMGAGHLSNEELDREAEKVYRLFLEGNTKAALARHFGVTGEVVNRRLARARRILGEDSLNDMRTDVESSLNEMIRRSYQALKGAETVAEKNSVHRTIADLVMKKSKLLGLEMPSKLTVEMESLNLIHDQADPVWSEP
ncbi:hypothetical protein [Streptomyces sp. NPDC090022]|uniref:hypothetical protein n=1 Tax=Streptomyces sp. NPDC090022 TaxID=3365920 RepID=UPI0037FBB201